MTENAELLGMNNKITGALTLTKLVNLKKTEGETEKDIFPELKEEYTELTQEISNLTREKAELTSLKEKVTGAPTLARLLNLQEGGEDLFSELKQEYEELTAENSDLEKSNLVLTNVKRAAALSKLVTIKADQENYVISEMVRNEVADLQAANQRLLMITDSIIPDDLLKSITIYSAVLGKNLKVFLAKGITGQTENKLNDLAASLSPIIDNLSVNSSFTNFNSLENASGIAALMRDFQQIKTLDNFYLPLFAKMISLLNSANDVVTEALAHSVAKEILAKVTQ